MTTISEQILNRWQVRKTRKQKDAFIGFMQAQYPELKVEQGGFGKNKNLVLGDVASARILFTAHYDTCARMPIPNFLAPKNLLAVFGYGLLLCIPMVLVIAAVRLLMGLITESPLLLYWVPYLSGLGSLFLLLMGGPPNPHTVNDNTSGVIVLCELLEALSPEQRKEAAFVFFDNEENGLLGSAWFAKVHKKENLQNKLVLNFDCVSDGDHILLVHNAAAEKTWRTTLESVFVPMEGKQIHFEKSSGAIYPSDQANFPLGVAVAAMKYSKPIGLYLNRIHTARDTVFQEENIAYLVRCSQQLLTQEVDYAA